MATYTIENAAGACREMESEELAAYEVDELTFQGAMDLPDGCEFARTYDEAGNKVTIYRED